MSDIFREVDDALQQEKLLNIWNEYKSTIIAAIAILIIGSGLTNFYHNWNTKRNATETARLTNALEAEDTHKIIQELAKDTRKSHAALGLMAAANLQLQKGKTVEAATLYKQVASNKKTPRDIRDLARILYVQNTKTPEMDVLQPLLGNDKSPWIWHARIEGAVITAHQKKDFEGALYYLEKFNTDQAKYVPATLTQRAGALAHIYQLKSQETQNKEDKNDTK